MKTYTYDGNLYDIESVAFQTDRLIDLLASGKHIKKGDREILEEAMAICYEIVRQTNLT